MPAIVLEVTNARRAFAARRALQDVSLRVAAGEVLALLGANGAGKTTLMRAVTGRLQLESGSVRVAGADPAVQAAARRALGIVPQSIALYPQLTARENLDVFARLMGLSGKAVGLAVREALERADLVERADDLLNELSGGMQRRLNIVAGTLHKPQLLLLDEPTVGVDLNAREAIHALLHDLRDAGMAIMFSTHDFDQAASVADRVAFMALGKMLCEGSVTELVRGVFGESKEGLVELAVPATVAIEKILRAFDLNPARDNRLWSGPLPGGYAELADIEQQLEQAGAHVVELRIREPGLSGVFMQLTGEAEGL